MDALADEYVAMKFYGSLVEIIITGWRLHPAISPIIMTFFLSFTAIHLWCRVYCDAILASLFAHPDSIKPSLSALISGGLVLVAFIVGCVQTYAHPTLTFYNLWLALTFLGYIWSFQTIQMIYILRYRPLSRPCLRLHPLLPLCPILVQTNEVCKLSPPKLKSQ